MIHARIHFLGLAVVAALAVGCGGADAETRTGGRALSPECSAVVEQCKNGCRAEADQAARGPCFDKCLRKAQTCK